MSYKKALKPRSYIIYYTGSGLGTRGIISSPSLADRLYQFIEHDKTLDKEIDIKRYYKY